MARGTMTTTLRNRLLLLLVLPVCVLAVAGSWWGYRSAETAAGQHDQRLLRLLPQLADSVMAPAIGKDMEPLMALSPSIDDFVRNRSGITGFAVADLDGHVLAGDPWISWWCPPRRRRNSTARSSVASPTAWPCSAP
jgi:two-component system sensor histidine kinase TctE